MDGKILVSFIGKSPNDPSFDAWLQEHRIFERPHLAEQDEEYEEDTEAAAINARNSEIEENEKHSIALIYENQDNYNRIFKDNSIHMDGDFILKQVAFYAQGVSSYRGFQGTLPFGLVFSDTQTLVHQKLGKPIASRFIHNLSADLWVTPDWHINISYVHLSGTIAIIHIRRPNIYDLRMIGNHSPDISSAIRDRMPSPHNLSHALGFAIDDLRLADAFKPIIWDQDSLNEANHTEEVFRYTKNYGLSLYFREGKDFRRESNPLPKYGTFFAGYRLNRAGDMESDGFQGQLPFGLSFHDTPLEILKHMGQPPDKKGTSSDTGYFIWDLPSYRVHIVYSLIDWQLYRITFFAPFAR